MTESSNAHIC